MEGFDFHASPKLPAAQIRDLAALRWLHSGESVILFGPVGVGKTHVAQALGHQAVRQGANVRFSKTSRILGELVGGHADRTWDKRMRDLIRPDVFILDDFAMRQLSAPQADDLYELVSERQVFSERPSEKHLRLRRPTPPLGRRTQHCLDDAPAATPATTNGSSSTSPACPCRGHPRPPPARPGRPVMDQLPR